jgi:hypothetical protein
LVTVVSRAFADKYHWYVETYPIRGEETQKKFDRRKKELREHGFLVRTKWFSSLSAYGLRAIKGKTEEADKKDMVEFVKF